MTLKQKIGLPWLHIVCVDYVDIMDIMLSIQNSACFASIKKTITWNGKPQTQITNACYIHYHGLTLIPAFTSNYIHYIVEVKSFICM